MGKSGGGSCGKDSGADGGCHDSGGGDDYSGGLADRGRNGSTGGDCVSADERGRLAGGRAMIWEEEKELSGLLEEE